MTTQVAMGVRILMCLALWTGFSAPGAVAQTVRTVVSDHPDLKDYVVVHESGAVYVSNQRDKISVVNDRGVVTPFVTGFTFVTGLVFASDGTLYASDSGTNEVLKISPDRNVSVFASGLEGPGQIGPVGLVFDQDNNLYVSVYGGSIHKITPNGTMTTLAEGGNLTTPAGLAIDESGNLYAANFFSGEIVSVTPGGETSLLATIPSWLGYMTYAGGALYATGYNTHKIYRITLDGQVSTFAGSGNRGQTDDRSIFATFDTPNGIAANLDGTGLFITSDIPTGSLRFIDGVRAVETATEQVSPFVGYALGSNYPNPFRKTTTLTFTLAEPDNVTITLHDGLGRTIRSLANGPYTSGDHSVILDAGDLPSGPYFYLMRTLRGYTAGRGMVHVGTRAAHRNNLNSSAEISPSANQLSQ